MIACYEYTCEHSMKYFRWEENYKVTFAFCHAVSLFSSATIRKERKVSDLTNNTVIAETEG